MAQGETLKSLAGLSDPSSDSSSGIPNKTYKKRV